MAAASLHALLAHSIDYAGMFPPCSLELKPAVRNQAQYVRSNDAWMLNSFVLPVENFEAAAPSFSLFDNKHPLRVSALAAKGAEFAKTAEAIRRITQDHLRGVSVVQLETPIAPNADLASLRDARTALGDSKLQVFWEAPPDSAETIIPLLAQLKEPRFGYKLRTGGVTADAFPSAVQVAETLLVATQHHVPIKFTAGLHHPIRQFRDEVGAKMHGFLNVLGAAVLASEHHWDEGQIVQMLEDEHPESFSFEETIFAWREWEITAERINARRKYVTSFGSCSFEEPREDLRALNLL
jgi:hypothetical protein